MRRHPLPTMNVQLDHANHRPGARRLPLRLLLHDLVLAANVGALFRVADALGVDRLYLSGQTPSPPDVRLRRAARSTQDHVPWEAVTDPAALAAALRAQGWRIVSLELTSASIDLAGFAVAPQDRICLILGNEGAGVAQSLLDISEVSVHIPMRGHNSSMNVATAGAIAVYELGRRLGA